jgi:diketogulonate reductase-like aldo/keto reductase
MTDLPDEEKGRGRTRATIPQTDRHSTSAAASADATSPFKAVAEKHGVSEAQLLLRRGVQNGCAVLPETMDPGPLLRQIEVVELALMAETEAAGYGEGAERTMRRRVLASAAHFSAC